MVRIRLGGRIPSSSSSGLSAIVYRRSNRKRTESERSRRQADKDKNVTLLRRGRNIREIWQNVVTLEIVRFFTFATFITLATSSHSSSSDATVVAPTVYSYDPAGLDSHHVHGMTHLRAAVVRRLAAVVGFRTVVLRFALAADGLRFACDVDRLAPDLVAVLLADLVLLAVLVLDADFLVVFVFAPVFVRVRDRERVARVAPPDMPCCCCMSSSADGRRSSSSCAFRMGRPTRSGRRYMPYFGSGTSLMVFVKSPSLS